MLKKNKTHYLVFIILFVLNIDSYSQGYNLDEEINGTTISACDFMFYDSGGPTKDYYENETYTVTICAPEGEVLEIDFSTFNIASTDVLNIYEGTSTSSPLLASLTGDDTSSDLQSTTQCITIEFISDATVVSDGWAIQINCVEPDCQDFEIHPSINGSEEYEHTVCINEDVTLNLEDINFPNNNITYFQSTSNTNFNLDMDNGITSTSYPLTTSYGSGGVYYVDFMATDAYDCNEIVHFKINVICQPIEIELTSSTHEIIDNVIQDVCLGDEVELECNIIPSEEPCYLVDNSNSTFLWSDGGSGNTNSISVILPDPDNTFEPIISHGDFTIFDQNNCDHNIIYYFEAECQEVEAECNSSSHPTLNDTINICLGETVDFESLVSFPENDFCYHQSEDNSNFLWNFGDATTGSGQNPSHTFDWLYDNSFEPVFLITRVNIYDQFNCYYSDTIFIETECQEFDFDFSSSSNSIENDTIIDACLHTDIFLSTDISFFQNDSCYHQDTSYVTVTWFLDSIENVVGNGINTVLNFSEPGEYDIWAIVKDQFGCHVWHHMYTTVTCQDFEVNINSSTNYIVDNILYACPDEDIELSGLGIFNNNYYCYTQSQLNSTFTWNIEGEIVTGINQVLNYSDIGNHNISLTITDSVNCTMNQSIEIQIPCQSIDISIESSHTIEQNVVMICPGDVVELTSICTYPNDTCYEQSDESSTLIWSIGNIVDTNYTITHTFDELGITEASFEIIDDQGCSTTREIVIYAFVDPSFESSTLSKDTLCFGDTLILNGQVETTAPIFETDTIALPDGSYEVYQSPLTFTIFPPEAVLTDINDIESVCLNIEHSYPGDLNIRLYCPNGQFVNLLNNPNLCEDNFLGEPVRTNTLPDLAGSPYNYCWSPTSTEGTLSDNVNSAFYSFTDNANNSYIDHAYFPENTYQADGDFTDLLGCPMYGDWEIYIYDYLEQDNGFLFSWDLNLNLGSFIVSDTVTFPSDNMFWTSSTVGNIISNEGNIAYAVPLELGNHDYTYQVASKYGCQYDTTLTLYVAPFPIVSIEDDLVVCNAKEHLLEAEVTGGTAHWISSFTGNTTFTDFEDHNSNVEVTEFGTYTFSLIPNTVPTCQVKDSVNINFYEVVSDINVNDPFLCFDDTLGVEAGGVSSDSAHYFWNFYEGNILSGINEGPYELLYPLGPNQISLLVKDWVCVSDTYVYSFILPDPISIDEIAIVNNPCFGYCEGILDLTPKGGVPGFDYTWLKNDQIFSHEKEANNLCSHYDYTVIIEDANECIFTYTTQITEPDSLTYEYEFDQPSCFGYFDGSLSIFNVQGENQPYHYIWSSDGYDHPNLTNISAGHYTLTITDSLNCENIIIVDVTEPLPLVLATENNLTVCKNSYLLPNTSITGGILEEESHVFWKENGIDIYPPILIDTNTQINVFAKDANGCASNTEAINIGIFPKLQAYFSYEDTLCENSNTFINIFSFGGNEAEPNTYELNNIVYDQSPILYIGTQSETLELKIKNVCESITHELPITISEYPKIKPDFNLLYGCQPHKVNITQNIDQLQNEYQWNINNIEINRNNGTAFEHIINDPGKYTLSIIAKSKFGCISEETYHDLITVFPNPISNFHVPSQQITILNPGVSFENLSENNYINYWDFDDGQMSNDIDPYHNYTNMGNYHVQLITESEFGCTDTSYKIVQVDGEYTFYAPNAFSPNSDGENDFFRVFGLGIDPDHFKLIVYNRWGHPIWESDNIENGWNGRIGNEPVPQGTYKFLTIYRDTKGQKHEKSGNFTIIDSN